MQEAEAMEALIYYIMNTGGDNTAAEEGDIVLLEGMQGDEAMKALIYYIILYYEYRWR